MLFPESFASISQPLSILASIVLSAVPVIWIIWRIRVPRDRQGEGTVDGILLLAALCCTLLTVLMLALTGVQTVQENRAFADWHAVDGELRRPCQVKKNENLNPRMGRTTFSLSCLVAYTVAGQQYEQTARAGSPHRRAALDRWIENHPTGSRVHLYINPADPRETWGLGYGTPVNTRTSYHAARQSLLVSIFSPVFFLVSRMIVWQRRKAIASASQR